ncbi:class I SAM-dependent DNA methyltransferase [Aquihabitans sp. McL0605]|uniref:class I SAM-dependent DNA methyltransferase n=1 Tax=Aquihabitans sp. McL0605 TaxID=3415671 RepID=UPI003CE8FD71
MDGYDHATYGDRFAAVYDDWYQGITDAPTCAALLAELADLEGHAGGGPVLELGVGTGRLALPLSAMGVQVVGVDASEAMLAELAAKDGGGAVEAVLGDMAAPPLGDRAFAVVFVAYNTLFNLVDPADQQRCIADAAARLLPGGSFVVEAFVPVPGRAQEAVAPRTITADRVVLSVSQTDPGRQEALGQYVDITEAGITLRPWHIRWSTPEQLDDMAAAAGLVLADRWADWERTPFGPDSPSHVSRYTAPPT